MTRNKPTLRVCPFCGEYEGIVETETLLIEREPSDSVVVRCENCGAKGPPAFNCDESYALKFWTERKLPTLPPLR